MNPTFTFGKPGDKGSIPPLSETDVVPERLYCPEEALYGPEAIVIDEYERLVVDPSDEALQAFKAKLSTSFQEFLVTGIGEVFYESVSEIDHGPFRYEVVKKIVNAGFDQGSIGKELVSRLLSYLYSKLLLRKDIELGFYCLIQRESDLKLDVPEVNIKLGKFLARAVMDDVLPPAFISRSEFLKSPSVTHAKVLLSFRDHPIEGIWGLGSSRSLSDLKEDILVLTREYYDSGDLKDYIEGVRKLDCPYYHHEVVRKAIMLALDLPKGKALFLSLVKEIFAIGLTSLAQIRNGFLRVEEMMADLKIDCPHAEEWVGSFREELDKAGISTVWEQ